MNWGAFLGGATKSYLDTSEQLEAQKLARLQRERFERQAKDEEGFRAAQAAAAKPEYEGGTAIPTIVDQGFSSYDDQQKGQLKTALGGMTPEQQQTALRSYGQSDPAMDLSKIGVYQNPEGKILGTNEYTELTPSEQQSRVLKQMQKEGNVYGIEKSLGLKKGLRENDMNDKFDAFTKSLTEDLSLVESTIQKGGLKAIPDALNPRIKDEGLKAEYVDGKMGGAVVVKDIKTGKIVGEPYTTAEQISKAVSGAEFDVFGKEMMQFFNSPNDMVAWAKARTEIKQRDRQLGQKDREIEISAGDKASAAAYRNRMAGISEKDSRSRNTVTYMNPETKETITQQKEEPVPKGFMPVPAAQTAMTNSRSTGTVKSYVDPKTGDSALLVNGQLMSLSTGKPVEDPRSYVPLDRGYGEATEQKVQEYAEKLVLADPSLSEDDAYARAMKKYGAQVDVGGGRDAGMIALFEAIHANKKKEEAAAAERTRKNNPPRTAIPDMNVAP